ncbi:hypothetical protein COV20_02455 [Candidatus Woesearchaeota archaeon CG10_big_fil_rev_8_21_14_0_10_45_16]|nr:MAG: hypothetical protein COV20_02455 [Candidatus Woesearchaeota archaeon CG10_big_fil_rev_8_21_14_0_10_45_16]
MTNVNTKLLFHSKVIVMLLILQLVIDYIFVFIYPEVNPIRATLIGATALVILFLLPWSKDWSRLPAWLAFLPIYSSALFGALLVQADYLVSKSVVSAVVHALILIVTYVIIVFARK